MFITALLIGLIGALVSMGKPYDGRNKTITANRHWIISRYRFGRCKNRRNHGSSIPAFMDGNFWRRSHSYDGCRCREYP